MWKEQGVAWRGFVSDVFIPTFFSLTVSSRLAVACGQGVPAETFVRHLSTSFHDSTPFPTINRGRLVV